jgi:uncharacterized protein
MQIELANLEGGKSEFANVYQQDELVLDDELVRLCGPTEVSGQIRHAGAEVRLSGHVDSCAEVDCDRCLKPIQLPVSTDFELEYISSSDYQENRNLELTQDEMAVSVFDGVAIDLDEIVKEQILLTVPTRSLCKTDCKGFCPTCGVNKNAGECSCEVKEIDPRWAALKDLVNGK